MEQAKQQYQQEIARIRWDAEDGLVKERFQRFFEWYQTINPARSYDEDAIQRFRNLIELEDEIPDKQNREVKRNLNGLVSNIRYLQTNFDKNDIIQQVVERFIYSKGFRLNHEDTEANKEKILKLSSTENSPASTESSDKECNTTSELLSPDEDELIKESENLDDLSDSEIGPVGNENNEDEDMNIGPEDLEDEADKLLKQLQDFLEDADIENIINTPEIHPSPENLESENSEISEISEQYNHSSDSDNNFSHDDLFINTPSPQSSENSDSESTTSQETTTSEESDLGLQRLFNMGHQVTDADMANFYQNLYGMDPRNAAPAPNQTVLGRLEAIQAAAAATSISAPMFGGTGEEDPDEWII